MHVHLLVHDVVFNEPRAVRSNQTLGEWNVTQDVEVFEKNGGHHLVTLHFASTHPTATSAVSKAIAEGR